MFSDKKTKESEIQNTGQNRINDGTTLKGDVTSNGYFRIDGIIEGNVKTPSKVVIGKTGVIIGTLSCKNADIEGKIKGVIDVSDTLTLKSTANIEGEVVVGKLAVEPGAIFNATCLMKGSKKTATTTTKEITKDLPYDRSQRTSSTTSQQAQV
ncbi:MAG: polymer-forming cytoskeletal protein [Flavobacteriaceae bacterium]|nr:polymer-forming cytoskeletal protein [Flavobacteriaceae bacterium]